MPVDGLVVGGGNRTAECSLDAERIEPGAGGKCDGDHLAPVSGGEAAGTGKLSGDSLEPGVGVAKFPVHRIGERTIIPGFALAGPGEFELDQALRFGKRERTEEELVEE